MWPDRVSNPGPLTYKSGAVPIALRSPATCFEDVQSNLCDLNGNFLKPPDFSNLTISRDLFWYYLM